MPVDPSPNDQLYEYGAVPPLADAVNVTCWPVCGDDGVNVKLADRGDGGLVTETVLWDVAVCCGDPLSLTVRVTVNEPADE